MHYTILHQLFRNVYVVNKLINVWFSYLEFRLTFWNANDDIIIKILLSLAPLVNESSKSAGNYAATIQATNELHGKFDKILLQKYVLMKPLVTSWNYILRQFME